MEKQIEALVKKAVDAHDAGEAMKFAQAACNVANAFATVDNTKRK